MNAWELKREAALRARMEKIRECRTSGKTVKVWCEENGIRMIGQKELSEI